MLGPRDPMQARHKGDLVTQLGGFTSRPNGRLSRRELFAGGAKLSAGLSAGWLLAA